MLRTQPPIAPRCVISTRSHRYYTALVPDTYRIVNKTDVITTMPFGCACPLPFVCLCVVMCVRAHASFCGMWLCLCVCACMCMFMCVCVYV